MYQRSQFCLKKKKEREMGKKRKRRKEKGQEFILISEKGYKEVGKFRIFFKEKQIAQSVQRMTISFIQKLFTYNLLCRPQMLKQ